MLRLLIGCHTWGPLNAISLQINFVTIYTYFVTDEYSPHSNLSQVVLYFENHLMTTVRALPKLVYIFELLLPTGFLNSSAWFTVFVLLSQDDQLTYTKYALCAQHCSKRIETQHSCQVDSSFNHSEQEKKQTVGKDVPFTLRSDHHKTGPDVFVAAASDASNKWLLLHGPGTIVMIFKGKKFFFLK